MTAKATLAKEESLYQNSKQLLLKVARSNAAWLNKRLIESLPKSAEVIGVYHITMYEIDGANVFGVTVTFCDTDIIATLDVIGSECSIVLKQVTWKDESDLGGDYTEHSVCAGTFNLETGSFVELSSDLGDEGVSEDKLLSNPLFNQGVDLLAENLGVYA